MILIGVEHFIVGAEVREATERTLRQAGRDGFECFVLWTGMIADEGFRIQKAYVPDQRSMREDDELSVHVDSTALFDLNRWLYENNQLLCAQIHTHPGAAYHSEVDELYPIMTTQGGLSIVLPNFGSEGFSASGIVGFRLFADGWHELPAGFIGEFLELEP